MNIRDAKKNELDFIREQRVNAYSEYAQVINTEHWQALRQAIYSEADIHPGVERMVAEIDGKIVGSVALFPSNSDAYEGYVEELDYPEIRMLAVTPEARGQGVASALIDECIRRAKSNGYHSIGLHTADFMKSAIKLYGRMGFERLPQYDFEPANDGIIVKAFKLSF
ncbi:GNAT family N-acetyltransferase [Aquibacillus sp. 3ASR75-11]|uniref:GNAT family N-acetyltransferase n=1 Tax=Terrihalobacillus insolitus TaxID=2950438 RepID=A0A9X4ANE4_9BACI|nr:GNAT family N-acetyltransferase [Terrihalobacillus insolitus]MDC3414585.1 GNAT family N-acetyltransferase [Terrihalobacillus insolitus]MDC3425739.1 GNAT family N-acetyltransferase [Terrihalobacillus insolitus]